MKVYIDGEFFEEAEAKISVFDHGLLYGDGVFEGIRFYGGGVFLLDEHLQRLLDSARAIHLQIAMDLAELREAVLETVRINGLRDGYIRLVATRGSGGLGLNPYVCRRSSMIIIASTIQLYPEEKYRDGLTVVTCSTRRTGPAALSPTVKSLNYLNNILAKIEALHAGADEGLMLNEQGYVAECTGDNIFVVRGNTIRTPPATSGALRGITRQVVLELAKEAGWEAGEENLTRYEVYTADECFLTGTAAEVIPLVRIDARPVGDGRPGPATLELMRRFRERTASCTTPVYP
ncbi:MAG TPA: branched-chain-amino-acid transaminase [Verrucomicrobiales bacterium]|nr:branched-chain-amino-acid transaminase [Verrucomicrobiales bacterium]